MTAPNNSSASPRRAALAAFLGCILGAAAVVGATHVLAPGAPDPVLPGDFAAALAQADAGDVVVVVREGCPACASAKAWLLERGLTPRIVAFDDEPERARRVANAVGVDLVPLLVLPDRAIVGFQPEHWASAFER